MQDSKCMCNITFKVHLELCILEYAQVVISFSPQHSLFLLLFKIVHLL